MPSVCAQLHEQYGLHPIIGAEAEFYYRPAACDATFTNLAQQLAQRFPLFEKLQRENGHGQLEFALKHTGDIAQLIEQYQAVKQWLLQSAPADHISFCAKPFEDQPASGLHIHIHLSTPNGANAFYKSDAEISEPLRHSIAGLLATMQDAANTLWTTPGDIARIHSRANDIPTTISWGGNNRSCAIRLPDKPPHQKHIEYRLAGADADITQVIALVLKGILHGLQHKPPLQPQTFGNAGDAHYNLKRLLLS